MTVVGVERVQRPGAGAMGSGGSGGGGGGGGWRDQHPSSSSFLLVLDPSQSPRELEGALRERSIRWQRMVKRGAHTFKASAYQIVYCPPGMASAAEREAGKYIEANAHIET